MVHTLSDGERQKVMIAKALAQETPVIFLDEPTAFLDFPQQSRNHATVAPFEQKPEDHLPFHTRLEWLYR
jgi:ABC-type cobalamin/Fe3+-siderophores transport system ATPase subunit